MSCSTCNKVETKITGLEYSWTQPTSSVRLPSGDVVRLTEPLIRRPHEPRGGWQVELRVKGQVRVVPGRSAVEVRNNAEALFRANDIEIHPLDLWLNLHTQWLARTPCKYRLIEVDQLLALSAPAPQGDAEPHAVDSWDPAEWGGRVWDFLGLYLRGERYDSRVFISMLEACRSMTDPVTNRGTGSANAHILFNSRVSTAVKSSLFTREEARAWLVETMRILGLIMGVKDASLEAVGRNNRWQPQV